MPKSKIVDVVHQTAEMKGQQIVTKCGVEGKADKVRHSSWASEITCGDCLR